MIEGDEFTLEHWHSERFQEVITDLFRGRGRVLKRGAPEEAEFEAFFQKYLERREQQQQQQDQRRRPSDATEKRHDRRPDSSQDDAAVSAFSLPQRFDPRYMINLSVVQPEPRRDERPSRHLRLYHHPVIQDFRHILQMFLDFRAKNGLEKIQKLRRDQASLPIAANRQEIVDTVSSRQVTLIAGDTGCGKSTQVVQYLLAAGFTNIVCTQPRRISAMSLCRRVAFETLNEYGSEVAYQIRFETSRTQRTRILFMTEGVLLRQLMQDPDLPDYNVVIVDEVHERHVTCDFLLGLLKGLLSRRPDLKLVLMSATINAELFSSYFNDAPMIRVPGRLYPVEVRYVPTKKDMSKSAMEKLSSIRDREDGGSSGRYELSKLRMEHRLSRESFDPSDYVRLLQQIDEQYDPQERGDLLMFLSGMAEMQAVKDAAKPYVERTRRWIVLLLHSSLSMEEQDRAFQAAPPGMRKCILSTNIAETSVTIDGIRFVADSGKAKELMWDPNTGTRSLQEFWISKASAQQRKGRAGRTGPGICFRFYSEKTFNTLVPFAEPEIVRTPLEGIILQLKAMGWADPREFQFITPPPAQHLTAAATSLAILGATQPAAAAGATQADESSITDLLHRAPITPLGRFLAGIPVEPNVGKIIALGTAFDLADALATLAAAMSVRSPFEQVTSRGDETADEQYRRHRFDAEDGDPFTVVAVFREWTVQKTKRRHTRGWCRKYYINEQRLYELTMVRQQLLSSVRGATTSTGFGSRRSAIDLDNIRSSGGRDEDWPEGRPSKRQLQRLKLEESRKRSKRMLSPDDVREEGGGGGELDIQSDAADLADEEPPDAELDLHDLEFRMRSDVRHLASEVSMPRSAREQWAIKIILCAGLYPQFAIADPANLARPQADYQFSTMLRDGLVIHPSSVCARHNLDASASASSAHDRAQSRYLYDDRVAIYVYGNLLQTKKSMLCNIFRMPALQTCLLFARKIYTSADMLEILVDDWLLFELSSPAHVVGSLLVECCRLRTAMASLLASVIPQTAAPSSSASAAGHVGEHQQADDAMLRRQLEGLLEQREHPLGQLAMDCFRASLAAKHAGSPPRSEDVARDLASFVVTDVGEYSMKKVPEHLTAAYLHQTQPHAAPAAVSREEALFADMVPTVQGIQATAFLQLGGLRDRAARAEYLASTDNLRYRWDCPSCRKAIMVTAAEMEQHIGTCCQRRAQERESKGAAEPKKRPKLGTAVR